MVRQDVNGAPGGVRTPGLLVRSLILGKKTTPKNAKHFSLIRFIAGYYEIFFEACDILKQGGFWGTKTNKGTNTKKMKSREHFSVRRVQVQYHARYNLKSEVRL